MVDGPVARTLAACLALVSSGAWAQGDGYTYVKVSLGVPWALYFFFMILVLMPFAVMILLAWRRRLHDRSEDE